MATFAPGAGRNRFGKAISLRIRGLDKVQADFKRIERSSDGILTKIIHVTANNIAKRANRDVPVDTGRLIKSIDVKKWTLRANVLVNAPYALFVEKGTRNMKAQPYFFKHIEPEMKKLTDYIKTRNQMIDTFAPVRTAYFAALDGNITVTLPVLGSTVIPVHSHVPDSEGDFYIYLGNQIDSGGEDVGTRTKDNRYATEHIIEIWAVSRFVTADKNTTYKAADDMATEILQIVLADTPLTITGVENVTASYESGTYEVEKSDTHLTIARQIVIRHLLSQN